MDTPAPMPLAESKQSKSIVYSLQKGLRVLEAFTAKEPERLLSEIARAAGLDNATAFRILNTLVLLGYVEKVPDTKRFRLSLKCLDLGFNAIGRTDLRLLARPVLNDLVARGAGAASLAILDKGDAVYIERVQAGLTRIVVDIRVGTRIPAFASAIGRAILAYLPEDAQRREIALRPREKLTPYTETDLDALLDELRTIREQGYSVVNQESVIGLMAIAAPIFGSDGLAIAAVSTAAAIAAHPVDEYAARFAPHLQAAGATLSRVLQTSGGIAGGV